KTESAPVTKFRLKSIIVPISPINKLRIKACPVFIRPDGNGLSAVRAISLSRSRSNISLKPFADPVTRKPLTVKISQCIQLITPCTWLPIRKATDAENTTVKVNLSFTSFLKSSVILFTSYPKAQYNGWFYLIIKGDNTALQTQMRPTVNEQSAYMRAFQNKPVPNRLQSAIP